MYNHDFCWCFTISSTDQSNHKPADAERDDFKGNETPSACDQSTQTENVHDFVKEPLEENITEEQGNETEVWIYFSWFVF